jgi:hypothetical protein
VLILLPDGVVFDDLLKAPLPHPSRDLNISILPVGFTSCGGDWDSQTFEELLKERAKVRPCVAPHALRVLRPVGPPEFICHQQVLTREEVGFFEHGPHYLEGGVNIQHVQPRDLSPIAQLHFDHVESQLLTEVSCALGLYSPRDLRGLMLTF